MSELLTDVFVEAADRFGEKEIFSFINQENMTLKIFNEESARVSESLSALGVQKGNKLILQGSNSKEWLLIFFACLKIGAVPILFPSHFNAVEYENFLSSDKSISLILICEYKFNFNFAYFNKICKNTKYFIFSSSKQKYFTNDNKKIIAFSDFILQYKCKTKEALSCDIKKSDAAFILFSSGSGGAPKCVEVNGENFLLSCRAFAESCGIVNNDVILLSLPFCHIMGLRILFEGIISGAKIIITEKFDADRQIEYMQRESVTLTAGVPTMYTAMINSGTKYIRQNLRAVIIGGASANRHMLNGIFDKFHIPLLYIDYGMTEILFGTIFCLKKDDLREYHNQVGKPPNYLQIKILADKSDAGQISFNGSTVIKRYYNCTDSVCDSDGWFQTGDIGRIDSDGCLHILGRKKDVINKGGESLNPAEIEDVIMSYSQIKDVQVVGIYDKFYGQKTAACILSDVKIDKNDLLAFIQAKLSYRKVPCEVFSFKYFPLTSSGKVNKEMLRRIVSKLYRKKEKQK